MIGYVEFWEVLSIKSEANVFVAPNFVVDCVGLAEIVENSSHVLMRTHRQECSPHWQFCFVIRGKENQMQR